MLHAIQRMPNCNGGNGKRELFNEMQVIQNSLMRYQVN